MTTGTTMTNGETCERLQAIIDETQSTIQAYDTKASILATLLTLAVGFINFNFLGQLDTNLLLKQLVTLSSAFGLISAISAALVLYPLNNPTQGITHSGVNTKGTYYVLNAMNLRSYLDLLSQTIWVEELAFEVLKSVNIRNRKQRVFLFSLRLALATLLLIGTSVIVAIYKLKFTYVL